MQVANAFRGKSDIEVERLPEQWQHLVNTLNSKDTVHPQPFFSGNGAKRRFVTLHNLSLLIRRIAESMGRASECLEDPTLPGGRLDWLQPSCILSSTEDPGDRSQWHLQRWMLTANQRSQYDLIDGHADNTEQTLIVADVNTNQ